MPVEHLGIEPDTLTVNFMPLEHASTPIYTSKSPFYRVKEPQHKSEHSASDDDASRDYTDLAQQMKEQNRQEDLMRKKEENMEFVRRIFNHDKVPPGRLKEAKGQTYLQQFAKKFPSDLCKGLNQKGYLTANQFRSTNQARAPKEAV